MSPTKTPTMTILYVDKPEDSARFYEKLFKVSPAEVSPTFALFPLPSGLVLGLWSRHTVEPASGGTGGGCELAIRVASDAEVDAIHEEWTKLGARILQAPCVMDFGRTFTAVDADNHRIRVFHPGEA